MRSSNSQAARAHCAAVRQPPNASQRRAHCCSAPAGQERDEAGLGRDREDLPARSPSCAPDEVRGRLERAVAALSPTSGRHALRHSGGLPQRPHVRPRRDVVVPDDGPDRDLHRGAPRGPPAELAAALHDQRARPPGALPRVEPRRQAARGGPQRRLGLAVQRRGRRAALRVAAPVALALGWVPAAAGACASRRTWAASPTAAPLPQLPKNATPQQAPRGRPADARPRGRSSSRANRQRSSRRALGRRRRVHLRSTALLARLGPAAAAAPASTAGRRLVCAELARRCTR